MSRAAPLPALLLLLASCGGRPAAPSPGEHTPPGERARVLHLLPRYGEGVPPAAGKGPVARVEIAADPPARARGLMGRTSLEPDAGMLFVYPEPAPRSFWMKDCPMALSAAFLDGEGRILNIEEMAPGRGIPDAELPYYESKGEARFVLEMEAGWFAARGLAPGDRVEVAGALPGVVPR